MGCNGAVLHEFNPHHYFMPGTKARRIAKKKMQMYANRWQQEEGVDKTG